MLKLNTIYACGRNSTFSLIATLLLFFVSDDTLLFGTTPSLALLVTKILLYVVLFCVLAFRPCVDVKGFQRALPVCGTLLFLLSVSMAWNTDFTLNFGYRFFIFALCLLFATRIRFDDYVHAFLRILFFFSLVSVVSWLAIRVFPGFLSLLPSVTNSKGVAFPTFVLCSFLGESFRAISIFREPGVFAIYLIWGLVLEFFYLPQPSKWRPLVFSTAIVFTFSTLGFVSLLVIYSILFFRAKEGFSFFKKNWWVLLLGIVGVFVLFFNEHVYSNMFLRNFAGDTIEESAAFSRLASFVIPLNIAGSHPLFGVGITPFLDFQEQVGFELYGVFLGEGTGTNTILIEAAKHGFAYGAILLYLLYRLSRRVGGLGLGKYGIFVLLFGMFSSQCMPYSVFYSLLLMYGATYIENGDLRGMITRGIRR